MGETMRFRVGFFFEMAVVSSGDLKEIIAKEFQHWMGIL